ncbi:hypothetical protein [Paludisphaera mucosa]|uniref:Bacterial Pleckstrin homology domain-containing protein n=1 Tax=Paludisphaera mucosa TaxID=3030827 RepID=A0ABT6FK99_9BACT|nr:hypothetical protein [Paludisphaera mucosa]MDG3007810.1 hypothetical protein [Paludisphaera mucosa]
MATTGGVPEPETMVIGPFPGFWGAFVPSWRALGLAFAPTALIAVVDGLGLLDRAFPAPGGSGVPPWKGPAYLSSLLPIAGLLVWMARTVSWGSGTWRIEAAGVGHTPPKGEPIFLGWEDVEQVRLRGPAIVLRGRGGRIAIPAMIEHPRRRELHARVEARLAPHFDLAPRPRFRLPRSFGDALRMLARALAGATLVLAGFFVLSLMQDFGAPRGGWIGRTVVMTWILAGLAIIPAASRESDAAWISRRPEPPRPPIG